MGPGTLGPCEIWVVAAAATDFEARFGFAADQYDQSAIAGNGDDAYVLADAGTGAPVDVFGEVGTVPDTGDGWLWVDSTVQRDAAVVSGQGVFDVLQWTVRPVVDATPGVR
jgi:hypothetical protein